jgi:hypothetical protein
MWGFLSLFIAVAGVLVYALSTSPKLAEIGRLAFFAGLWVFLLQNGTHIVSLTGR